MFITSKIQTTNQNNNTKHPETNKPTPNQPETQSKTSQPTNFLQQTNQTHNKVTKIKYKHPIPIAPPTTAQNNQTKPIQKFQTININTIIPRKLKVNQ